MGESLLERDFETRAVRRSLTDLAAGSGSVLALAAPAGLGKTALLRLAREQAREQGFRVLSARGAQLETDFAYGVVRQLVEPAVSTLVSADGAFPDDPAAELDEPGYASHSRFPGSPPVLLNALYRLMSGLAERTPVVVVVDDMQWVDPPSARFLGFLARRVESIAVTLIVGARSSRNQHDESLDEILTAAEIMLLQPRSLSRAAVAELIRREYGRPGDPEFCIACHATTNGNPLFLRELLRSLAAEGIKPVAGSVAAVRAAGPDAVRRHMLVALRRRSGAARAVARAVAVLGDDSDLAQVAWQCGQTLSVTAAAAEQLTRDGLFDRADPPAFAHPAVRDAVLTMTARSDRIIRPRPDQSAGGTSTGPDAPETSEHAAAATAAISATVAATAATSAATVATVATTTTTATRIDGSAHTVTAGRIDYSGRPDGSSLTQRPAEPAARLRPAGLEAFTTAEREVAGLAVSGLMNRQIAERLFLSEKTIESHLSRVYRKTGVRSRTQLAAHLASGGWPDRPEPLRIGRNHAETW